MNQTKTRLLDAAEQLLAERGFAACSLRAVTSAAGVNLGAVNYHFRSKETLIQAVFARRLEPLNRQRLEALDACERKAAGKAVPLADLLHAFLDPVLASDQDSRGFMSLIGLMYFEPSLDLQRLFRAELELTVGRFLRAFRMTLPELPPEELYWRLFFTIGALAQTLGAGPLLRLISGGICDPSNLKDAARRLVLFAGAGLRAAATPQSAKSGMKTRVPGKTRLQRGSARAKAGAS